MAVCDVDPVTVPLVDAEPEVEGDNVTEAVPVGEEQALPVTTEAEAHTVPVTVPLADTVGVPVGEKEKDAVAVEDTVCVAQLDTVLVPPNARLGEDVADCEGEEEADWEDQLAVPVGEDVAHAEGLAEAENTEAVPLEVTLGLPVALEEALLVGDIEGLPVTDGVKVSVAVLDGDGDALLEGRPDPVKEVVEVLLPQSVALDVKEEEGVTVGETDTVPVVDDV